MVLLMLRLARVMQSDAACRAIMDVKPLSEDSNR